MCVCVCVCVRVYIYVCVCVCVCVCVHERRFYLCKFYSFVKSVVPPFFLNHPLTRLQFSPVAPYSSLSRPFSLSLSLPIQLHPSVSSGFRREVDEICTLL